MPIIFYNVSHEVLGDVELRFIIILLLNATTWEDKIYCNTNSILDWGICIVGLVKEWYMKKYNQNIIKPLRMDFNKQNYPRNSFDKLLEELI